MWGQLQVSLGGEVVVVVPERVGSQGSSVVEHEEDEPIRQGVV